MSAMDPANTGAAKRGNITAKAERYFETAITNRTGQYLPAETLYSSWWEMRHIYSGQLGFKRWDAYVGFVGLPLT
jgi:hypothetical protein